MGKVWPRDSVAFNQATTQLSTITALDESPLLADLIYIGTFDGLIQVTEDGGKTWRKVEKLPGLPEYTAVTDVAASTRDANTVYATFNNYQRGDFKPYVYKSTDRGRTWTSIAGNLPQRSGAWSIVQDHLNGDLMFAGMEFGVWFTVDGGARWTQLKGGIPTTQARDLQIQRRESDLVVGTFGRGAYILDDYSALRAVTAQALTEDARLFPLRDAYMLQRAQSQHGRVGQRVDAESRRIGAVFTYHVGQAPAADAKLVLTIADDTGRPVRRLDLAKELVSSASPGICAARRRGWRRSRRRPRRQRRGKSKPPQRNEEAAGRTAGVRRTWRSGGAARRRRSVSSHARSHGRRHRHAHR